MASMVRRFLCLVVLVSCFSGLLELMSVPVNAQQRVWVPNCTGVATADTAQFTAIQNAIGATNPATIKLPFKTNVAQRCTLNSLTLNANIALDNVDGSGIFVVTGQTLTVNGPRVTPPSKTMFFNVGPAQGIVVLSGRGNEDRNPSTGQSAQGDLFYGGNGSHYSASAANQADEVLTAKKQLSPFNIAPGVFNLGSYGAKCDGTTADDTALAQALAVIGSNKATIRLPYTVTGQCLLSGNGVIPSNVSIDYGEGTGWKLTTGRTLTIQGPQLNAQPKQIYFNALVSQGTVSFSGNSLLYPATPQWWGAKGDGIVATVSTTNGSATITATTAVFTSTAADVGKLTDVNGAGPTLAGKIQYYGVVPAVDIKQNLVGSINTFTDSTHVILSGTASQTASGKQLVFGTDDQAAIQAAISSGAKIVYFPKGKYIIGSALTVANGSTAGLTFKGDGPFTSEIYTIGPKTYDNTSTFHALNILNGNSGILFKDLGFSGTNANGEFTSFGVDVADGVFVTTGAVNYFVTQPTGNITNIKADNCRFDNFWGAGFHAPGSGTAAGQRLTNFSFVNLPSVSYNAYDGLNPNIYDGLSVTGATYLLHNGTGGIEASVNGSTTIGPIFAQFNGSVGASMGGFGGGTFSKELNMTGGVYSDNGRDNSYTAQGIVISTSQNFNIVGPSVQRNSGIGIQLLAGATGHTGLIEAALVSNNGLTGAGSRMGIFSQMNDVAFSGNFVTNDGIAGYDQQRGIYIEAAVDKDRLVDNHMKSNSTCDYCFNGATNIVFNDHNPQATFTFFAGTDTFIFPAPGPETALTFSTNTIAPTSQFHSLGAGLIKTITVPLGITNNAQVFIRPTAAFTYDNTGNVLGSGTAVIGRTMIFTWSGTASKWAASY